MWNIIILTCTLIEGFKQLHLLIITISIFWVDFEINMGLQLSLLVTNVIFNKEFNVNRLFKSWLHHYDFERLYGCYIVRNDVFMRIELPLHLNIFCSLSSEIWSITCKYSGLMEVYVTHLVKTEIAHNFIAPFDIIVVDIVILVNNFVDSHQVVNFKLIPFNFNCSIKILIFDSFHMILQF
jgi:hypothetical protein